MNIFADLNLSKEAKIDEKRPNVLCNVGCIIGKYFSSNEYNCGTVREALNELATL
jgi:hypothetical protein